MTTETILTMDDKRRIMDSNMLPWHPQVVAAINDAEQAVLQSPEVQELRKERERYRRALERIAIWGRPWTKDDLYGRNWRGCAAEALHGGIDAAMEQKT